jgi:branched-chain amino acid aminotransferase
MNTERPDPNITVWFDNQFMPLGSANVNILSHAFNYGTGVFEGIRGYYDDRQQDLLLVRPAEHYDRWKRNAGIIRVDVPASARELCEITAELCRRNSFRSHVYARPLAYKCSARIGVAPDDNDAYAIVVVPFGDYLDSRNGVRAGVVSWRRIEDNAIPCRAKICGAYVNSVLATDEARRNGFDEAIFLTESGHVAEGATCNIFLVRNGMLVTPPGTDNILEGITRAAIIELARTEMRLEVVERSIDRSELYIADEIFFTGTAVELAPVVEVDHRQVAAGGIGPVSARLRGLYTEATRGRLPAYTRWLWPVYRTSAAGKAA